MSLTSGTRLGPYEIIAPLGEGGMGEVYRARDTKLARDVAIKILPESVAADPDRLMRFEREAKTLAALNHVNIAQIHGLEESAGQPALVLELVEGPTLADRIAQGPLPLDEALPIARQIAEALEAAHEQGVVHRDLKPANVKVRHDGLVKVLDFGLAKALEPGVSGQAMTGAMSAHSPTITSPAMTAMGMILGTAAYMAPEQAVGKPVDKRADIWAFGVVFIEMLTGQSPFKADSLPDTLSAVIRGGVDLSALPATTPTAVRRLLARCLDRIPSTRLRDIGEARITLSSSLDEMAATAPAAGWPWKPVAAAVILTAGLAGVLAWQLAPTPPELPLRKFALDDVADASAGTVSPDGARVAYFRDKAIWIRELDRLEPRKVIDVEALDAFGEHLFFSPDGRHLGYASEKQIFRVAIDGGPALSIATLPESGRMLNAAWGPDNRIVVSVWRGAVYEVPATGTGELTVRLPLREDIVDFHGVRILPDGDLLVAPHYFKERGDAESWIVSGSGTTVIPGIAAVQYVEGHLLYGRGDPNRGVWAMPFDVQARRSTGDPFLVAPGASAVWAANGLLIYLLAASEAESASDLVQLDASGNLIALPGQPTPAQDLAPSPDGRHVALVLLEKGQYSIVVRNVATGLDTPVVSGTASTIRDVAWSPDGRRILFSLQEGFLGTLVSVAADGSDKAQPLAPGGREPAISPDGRLLVFEIDDRGQRRIQSVRLTNGAVTGEPTLVRRPSDDVSRPIISTDGRLIAFVAHGDGAARVFVSRLTEGSGQWPVSSASGTPLGWMSATELVYIESPRPDGSLTLAQLKAVTLQVTDRDITAGAPRSVFTSTATGTENPALRLLRMVGAGERWVGLRARGTDAPSNRARVIVVQNWLSEFAGR